MIRISSIGEILPRLCSRPALLALDADRTLIEPASTLGSYEWYEFLKKIKPEFTANHRRWCATIRSEMTYRSCEDAKKVGSLVVNLRNKGWRVKVVTSRDEDLRELTVRHFKEARLPFTNEDIIFGTEDEEGDPLPKSSFLRSEKRVYFVDDWQGYCEDVGRLPQATTFLYGRKPPFSTDKLLVQLAHYATKGTILKDSETNLNDVDKAIQTLNMQSRNPNEIWSAMYRVFEYGPTSSHLPSES